MKKQIALVKGDGIGPEVVNEGINLLKTIYEDNTKEFILKELFCEKFGLPKFG